MENIYKENDLKLLGDMLELCKTKAKEKGLDSNKMCKYWKSEIKKLTKQYELLENKTK